MKKNLLILAFTAGLTGCATSPISTQDAFQIPENHFYDSQYLTPKDNTFTLTVKRDSGYMGSFVPFSIYLDATLIAEINTGEKIVLHLPKNEYILSAESGAGLYETNVVMDKDRVFRVGMGKNGDMILAPTAF